MDGYKTLMIGVVILTGTFGLIALTPELTPDLKVELWKWSVITTGSMWGIREFAEKFKKG